MASDTSKITFTVSHTPINANIPPFNYTSFPTADTSPTAYQVVEVFPISGTPFAVTAAFKNSLTAFAYYNQDTTSTVSVNLVPAGQTVAASNLFVVAVGGMFAGTIVGLKTQVFTFTSSNGAGSPGILYLAGN